MGMFDWSPLMNNGVVLAATGSGDAVAAATDAAPLQQHSRTDSQTLFAALRRQPEGFSSRWRGRGGGGGGGGAGAKS